jgi:hypothetical protein
VLSNFAIPLYLNTSQNLTYYTWNKPGIFSYVHQKSEQERHNVISISDESYKISQALSTHITVGKGDNIMIKLSKQIQDFLFEEEKKKYQVSR